MRAGGETIVNVTLRRQGIMVTKVKKKAYRSGKKITDKDLTLFTRQLATMMKAGVPLLQSFDIVGKGHANPSMSKLIMDLRADIETGTSLNNAFRKYPLYFDPLFCNLVGAGEQAGILEDLLTRLAIYKEKTLALKAKIKSALTYPISILAIAFIVTAVIMIWVVPAFKEVFTSFGADLPDPDPGRDGDVRVLRGEVVVPHLRLAVRRHLLLLPGLAPLAEDAAGDGPPAAAPADLRRRDPQGDHRALDPHPGDHVRRRRAAGRGARLGRRRLRQRGLPGRHPKIQNEVSTGTSLTVAMQNANVFPNMVTQMVRSAKNPAPSTACWARSPTSSRRKSTRPWPRCRR
jgi:type IV pilus assembly protein PilC